MIAQLAQDYLFIGSLIEARLVEQLAELDVPVEGIEQMSQAIDSQDMRHAVVYVMWGGDRFDTAESGRAGGGTSQRLMQQWIAFLRVRNASVMVKDARNAKAGQLLTTIHKALAGWTPPAAMRPLYRVQGPRPNYQPASGLYPLAFEINLAL